MDLPVLPTSSAVRPGTVEGIARVVAVADGTVWLEPEQTTSCGCCAAAGNCGSSREGGIGTVASRLEARRFRLGAVAAGFALQPGDRVVIGVGQRSLIKAALLAYGLPLVVALLTGSAVQGLYGNDLSTLLGMSAGLALGLVVARLGARLLARRGELQPQLLRLARPGETCGADPETP
ncbi:MAG TPA: SoxR reducing system RseC family protein [Azonexus sp.]